MCGNVRRLVGALKIATAVWLCVMAATLPAHAQSVVVERPLVLPFTVVVDGDVPGGQGAGFWLGEAAALLLAEELDARNIAVFSRSERVAAFASLQLPVTAPLTRATMIRVGELVGATELVVGEIDAILGEMDDEQDFAELVFTAWVETTEGERATAFAELGDKMAEAKAQYESVKVLDEELFGEDFVAA